MGRQENDTIARPLTDGTVGPVSVDPDWGELYLSLGPPVLRHVQRLVGPEVAPDLVHECFIRAMRAASIPDEAEQRKFWLYRIATNLALDHLRRQQRWEKIRALLPRPYQPPAPEERDLVRSALQEIPPEQAVALVLRLSEGVGRREAAALLGVSEATVKSRLARGRLNFVAAYRRLERS